MRKLIALVWAPIPDAGRKVVFSRTMTTADWDNTTIAAGDTAAEMDTAASNGVLELRYRRHR